MTLDLSTSEIFGFAAATLSTIAFLPQVIKTWRSQSAKDVSYALLTTFSTGCLCWVIYGYQVNAKPVMIANSFTLALNLTILAMKIAFERNNNDASGQVQQ
jgi:MtN3 and saliva related transmembrane protein